MSWIRRSVLHMLRLGGVDRAIAYTVLGRVWALLAGPVSLLIIAAFLSKEEQGFYYTFTSIVNLQTLFELGLSTVLLQFASHEKAHLEWTPAGTLAGDPAAHARLASLLRRSLFYYGLMTLLYLAVVLPAGVLFFNATGAAHPEVAWQVPWVWLVVVVGGLLFINPILAILEGCGLVADVARVRMIQGLLATGLLWLALSQHWGLLAAPVTNTVGLVFSSAWLLIRQRRFLLDLLPPRAGHAVIHWGREVWPFQWKVALSWISLYLTSQLLTPVLFAFQGAVVAGQMGMSLIVVTAISVLALAWVNTKSPLFGNLVARRDFSTLDRVFAQALRQSVIVAGLVGCAFWAVTVGFAALHLPLGQRLLDPWALALLLGATLMGHIQSSEAIYLRAHKQEPFVWLYFVSGLLLALSTYLLGRFYGTHAMLAGYLLLSALSLAVATWIFLRKRREWHTAPLPTALDPADPLLRATPRPAPEVPAGVD